MLQVKPLLCVFLLLLTACGSNPQHSQLQADPDRVDQLYGDRRLDEMTFLTAHNAFVNNDDSKWIAPNQGMMSLTEQMDAGASSIMVDIHSFEGMATLCHEKCLGVPLLFPRQSFVKLLNTVADYLRSKPEKFMTIFLEDYTSREELGAALDQSSIREMMFDPYKENVQRVGWPRVRDMIASGRRVLILSDRSGKNDLGVGFGRDFTVENYWSLGKISTDDACRTRWDNIPLDRTEPAFERLFVMNHFRDIPTAVTAALDNRYEVIWDRMQQECVKKAGRKPNFLAVDYLSYANHGARRVVDDLNRSVGLIYSNSNFSGAAQVLMPGRLNTSQMTIGDKVLSSLKVYSDGGTVRLFRSPDFRDPIKDVKNSSPYVGDDANDQVSSLIVE